MEPVCKKKSQKRKKFTILDLREPQLHSFAFITSILRVVKCSSQLNCNILDENATQTDFHLLTMGYKIGIYVKKSETSGNSCEYF